MKIWVHGRRGRLGKEIVALLNTDSLATEIENSNVVIDVSSPEGTKDILEECIKNKLPLVIGTTGHQLPFFEDLRMAAIHIPVMYISNFSPGIYFLTKSLEKIFGVYEKGYIDIIEAHHHEKKDTPSGTAIMLSNLIKKLSPESITQIHSLRQPHMLGTHTLVMNFGEEQIQLKHKALSRKVFASGAINAAKYLVTKPCGNYTMEDVYETNQTTKIYN